MYAALGWRRMWRADFTPNVDLMASAGLLPGGGMLESFRSARHLALVWRSVTSADGGQPVSGKAGEVAAGC